MLGGYFPGLNTHSTTVYSWWIPANLIASPSILFYSTRLLGLKELLQAPGHLQTSFSFKNEHSLFLTPV